MICPECGKEYGSRLLYCVSCGTKLIPQSDKGEGSKDLNDITHSIYHVDKDQLSLFNFTDGMNYDSSTSDESNDLISEYTHVYNETQNNDYFGDLISDTEPETEPVETIRRTQDKHNELTAMAARTACSLVTSLFLIIFVFMAVFTFSVRQGIIDGGITNLPEQYDLLSLPIADFYNMSTTGAEISGDTTILEAVYNITNEYGISRTQIIDVYNSEQFQAYLKENLDGCSDYFLNGYTDKTVTVQSVKELYSGNVETLNNLLGVKLTQQDIETALNEIDNSEMIIDSLSLKKIENGQNANTISVIRAFMSMPAMVIEIILVLSLIVSMMAIYKKPVISLRWTGIPLIISGIVVIAVTAMINSRLILYYNYSETERMIISAVSESSSQYVYLTGIIILITGFVFMFSASLIKKAVVRSSLKTQTA